ncbi:MAG: hypothetical protein KDB07_01725, partial [Planctomycetes bacterium]|nr:hypothetical protein [Planctomycetota bacterium]
IERFFELFPWPELPPLSWLSYRRKLLLKEEAYSEGFFSTPPFDISGPLDKGLGSISIALSAALAMGYREVVLCGLDLDVRSYFWNHKDHAFSSFRKPESDAPEGQHATSAHHKYHPIQDHLLAYHEFVMAPRGVKLSLGVSAGLLADKLPLHDWNSAT